MVYSAAGTTNGASMMDSSTVSGKRRIGANGAVNYGNGVLKPNMAAPKKLHRKQAIYHVTRVLWHLDVFRRSFREITNHSCSGETCIFCALKELFRQFQLGGDGVLPPEALRKALASTFSTQERLQLGRMDDAAECFETILLKIHAHLASSAEKEDACSSPICVPHLRFAMALVEQSVCQACGVRSEPLPFTQMVHYVSASALITSNSGDGPGSRHQRSQSAMDFSGNGSNGHYDTGPEMFGKRLRRAGGMGDIRDCPSGCGAKIQICRSLMNRPDIVSVGIVWDSERPNLDHIMSVFGTLGTHLRLSDVFQSVADEQWSSITSHHLVGLVAYYGKNYSTFFYHSKLSMWIYFDDSSVREIGPYWNQVVDKCRRGHFQPLLLMYANPNGQPVLPNVAEVIANGVPSPGKHIPHFSAAPAAKAQHPYGYGGSLPRNLNGARRAITPNPDSHREDTSEAIRRRAITPNPDQHYNQQSHQSEDYSDYQNVEAFRHMFAKNGAFSVFAGDKDDLDSSGMSEDKSSGPSSPDMKIKVPAAANFPGNRDSGNWSGDRNSASSSNSTSLENPYLYLPSGMSRKLNGNPGNSGKGTLKKNKQENGYDSYSLSSNDSYPARTQQPPNGKHSVLSNIPEGLQSWDKAKSQLSNQPDDCEKLCFESDKFFEISRLKEDSGDIDNAIAMCNTAATKARLAMDAPYNNPQAITFARMKHNACVMRLRSLQRKAVTRQESLNSHGSSASDEHESLKKLDGAQRGRHSRQGSKDSTGRRSSSHSRQNSGDNALSSSKSGKNHEIFGDNLRGSIVGIVNGYESGASNTANPSSGSKKSSSGKNIEIYATLPKKGSKKRMELEIVKQDKIETMPRSSKAKSLIEPTETSNGDESSLSEMSQSDVSKTKGDGKKQHKIRRKLLLGGLIKRKNRSMPDLREGQDGVPEAQAGTAQAEPKPRQATSRPSSPTSTPEKSSGYLSEGHSEYSNPNLERSKLMRRSFHHNAVGKQQQSPSHYCKVPPPPPMRTTSKLSPGPKVKSVVRAMNESFGEGPGAPPLPPRSTRRPVSWGCSQKNQDYENLESLAASRVQQNNLDSSVDSVTSPQSHSVTIMAQVHCQQENSPMELRHSRQSSGEDFPEPPPPLESAIPDLIREQAAGKWQPKKWAVASNLSQPPPATSGGASEQVQRQQPPTAAPSAKASFAKSVRALTSRFEQINSSFADEPQKEDDVIPWRNPVNKPPAAPWLAQGGVDCVDAGPQQRSTTPVNMNTGSLQRIPQPTGGNFGAHMGADVVDSRPAIHRLDEVLAEVQRGPAMPSPPTVATQATQYPMVEVQRSQAMPPSHAGPQVHQYQTAEFQRHPQSLQQGPTPGTSQLPPNYAATMDSRYAYQPAQAAANHVRAPSYGGTIPRPMGSPTQPPPPPSVTSMPAPEEKRNPPGLLKDARRPKSVNKKNVRFCDQVTLVAQNDPDAEKSLPNPILERVLRNAGLKSEQDLIPIDPSLVSPQGSIASTDSQSSTQSGAMFGHHMGNPKSPPPYTAAAGSQFWQGFPPAGLPPGATVKPSSGPTPQSTSIPPPSAQPIYDQRSNESKYGTSPAQTLSHPAWSSPTMATPMATASYCSLCRKKVVMPPNIYCTDCDFYMAKLKASKS